ncbi:MAG: bifunctional phosphoribosyl-AMP cyclohydrolase/phosphoribosyl-ATP diphosphatase [Candidatus Magasanikbacteria bacterium RIFOXYD2_FULL_41_14]|uniref:Histidine biosynthesis bifunctional protein HisIE n=1 Tax=Candidatus Magasanikbacteria bacterium RIFOXYD2_FULL_41_14 TaxID=1798709 RepID=A0A1F6PEJ6_9BACT|nr:MAG: bifunctional phosphoribosyl-AMP cyclohydrolase/phosphoribosyl-ATP diphosphatase [Candidatus Magasanikbacteria bacterium RIFOXYD2_FULL_41_14]
MKKISLKKINFSKLDGLVPAVIQDCDTKVVLMVGFMNKLALEKTIESGKVTFWSRSKKRLWEKGEESGNYLQVVSIADDCDGDTILILARPSGSVCHTGRYSCFNESFNGGLNFMSQLYNLLRTRKKELPKNSYSSSLFKGGIDRIVQKIGEEAAEVIIAGKNKSNRRVIEEFSDLLFHLTVLLVQRNIPFSKIILELEKRSEKSK